MLTEGVLGGGGASCVLAAVSQHALIATAASTVVKQGRLPHRRRELPTQYAAVGGTISSQLVRIQIFFRLNCEQQKC